MAIEQSLHSGIDAAATIVSALTVTPVHLNVRNRTRVRRNGSISAHEEGGAVQNSGVLFILATRTWTA